MVEDYILQKPDTDRVRITAGGNLFELPNEVTTQTTYLVTAEILQNSVVSTMNAKYIFAHVKSFYLNTLLECFEHMHMPIKLILQSFIDEYDLQHNTKDEFF